MSKLASSALILVREILRRIRITLGVRRIVRFARDLKVGKGTFIDAPNLLDIEERVSIGSYCFLGCDGSIGEGTLISSFVGFVGKYDHDMYAIGSFISAAPWIFSSSSQLNSSDSSVVVGKDVWIGYGATILGGVKIGRGAVVGARALVTRDVPEYAIVAGSPAKVVGTRFDDVDRVSHEAILAARFGPPRFKFEVSD